MKRIMQSEYKLKLVYPTHKQFSASQTYKESITCATSLELLTTYGIHTTQPSASVLVFESESDRMLAVLALSDAKEFTVQCV